MLYFITEGLLQKFFHRLKFLYYIVGKVEDIDVETILIEQGIKENVIITGFITIDEFKCYMGSCDYCLNLRYPTQGESSASLHRMLGMGKPVILTKIGAFLEYPDSFTIKARYDSNEVNDIYEAICKLADNPDLVESMSYNSYTFASKNCSIEKNAKKYSDFLYALSNNLFRESDLSERLLDTVWDLGLRDRAYIETIANRIE